MHAQPLRKENDVRSRGRCANLLFVRRRKDKHYGLQIEWTARMSFPRFAAVKWLMQNAARVGARSKRGFTGCPPSKAVPCSTSPSLYGDVRLFRASEASIFDYWCCSPLQLELSLGVPEGFVAIASLICYFPRKRSC